MQAWFMHVQQPPMTVTPSHRTPCLFGVISRQSRVFSRQNSDKWVFGQQAEFKILLVNLFVRLVVYFNKKY